MYMYVAMKVKFGLEQPSSTGVGHGLAYRGAHSCTAMVRT